MLAITHSWIVGSILLYKKDEEDWQIAAFFSSNTEKRKDLKVVLRDNKQTFDEIDLIIKKSNKVTLIEEQPKGGELVLSRLIELRDISDLLRRYRGDKTPCNPGAIEASIDKVEDEMRSIFNQLEEKAAIIEELKEIRNKD